MHYHQKALIYLQLCPNQFCQRDSQPAIHKFSQEQQNPSHYSLWWVEAQDSEISTHMGVAAFSPTTYLQD